MDQSKGMKANARKVKPARKISYDKLSDARSEIRLLSIAPGDWTDPIQASLETFERAAVPWFAAISYTWGDPKDIKSIFVNGKKVDVRYNCWYVLAQARYHGKGTSLWIDALCINQDDNEEKSWQVAQMGEIFSEADAVYCCVGAHVGDSEGLFEQFDEVLRYCKAANIDAASCKGFFGRQLVLEAALTKGIWRNERNARQFALAYGKFCKRPYWNRLWTLQEVLLGENKEVWCDLCILDWDFLIDFDERARADQLASRNTPIKSIRDFIFEYQHAINRYDGSNFYDTCRLPTSTNSILTLLCSKQCEDARDLFYGSSSITKLQIIPDYSKSTCEVAFEAIRALISAEVHSINIFRATSLHENVKGILKRMEVTAEDSFLDHKIQERLINGEYIGSNQDSITVGLEPNHNFSGINSRATILRLNESDDGQLALHPIDERKLMFKKSTSLIRRELLQKKIVQIGETGLTGLAIIRRDGTLLGVTSVRSRPGDVLFYVGSFDELDVTRYLVFRKYRASYSDYICIGQAVIFGTAGHTIHSNVGNDGVYFQPNVEDWLAFIAQSIIPRGRDPLDWALKCAVTDVAGPGGLSMTTLTIYH